MVTSTNWYRTGTVYAEAGSQIITGTNTYWLTAGLHPGDIFKIDGMDYEVYEITDNTHIKLAENYAGTTGSGKTYAIIRNFSAAMPANLAADMTDLMKIYEQIRSGIYLTIQGESAYQLAVKAGYIGTEAQWLNVLKGASAYELAVANGYTGTIVQWIESLKGLSAYDVAVAHGYEGTESEWLESLKAAGEWSTLDARTEMLANNNPAIRNCLYRGKNLGEFTSAHLAEVKAGRFTDMWLGDYFTYGSRRFAIAGFNRINESNNIVLYFLDRITSTDDYEASLERALDDPQDDPANWQYQYANHYYAETNFYLNVRPFVIAELEDIFGANNLKAFDITVPSASKVTHWQGPSTVSAWVTLTSKLHLPNIAMFGHTVATKQQIAHWKPLDQTLPLFRVHPGVVSPWAYSSDLFEQDHFSACSTGSWVLRPTGRVSHSATIHGALKADGTYHPIPSQLKPVFIIA